MVLLTIFPYSGPLLSRPVPGRSPNARLGSEAQSAAICRSWLLPAANMLNKATRTMNSVPWQRVRARRILAGAARRRRRFGDFSTCLPHHPPTRLSCVRLKVYFIPFVSATHARRCRLILSESMENIPDCNGSHLVILTPRLPSFSLSSSLTAPQFPHRRHLEPIGGRVTPSHKALKGSQTH